MKKYVLVFLLILVVVMGRGCGGEEEKSVRAYQNSEISVQKR